MQVEQQEVRERQVERVGGVLRWTGWLSFWVQIALAVVAALMLGFAVAGRSFNQAIDPAFGAAPGYEISPLSTTPGLGIGIFWAIAGIAVLLYGAFVAFRLTRFAKRMGNHDPAIHPRKIEVTNLLRLAVMAGLVGLLVTILGGGATLGVLIGKTISLPQGVAVYDPTRVVRSLDIFVAMANLVGITAHFIGILIPLSILNWLRNTA